MERETGLKGGRRQEMGLERTEGRTPDGKQRKIKRVRNERPALRAMERDASWGRNIQRWQMPSST